MNPDDMPRPLVLVSEHTRTVVTLEPIHLVMLHVVLQEVLGLETSSAVPNTAEVGMSDVHPTMNSDGHVVNGLKATQGTRELLTRNAFPLVHRIGFGLEIFTAIGTPGNFVDSEMTIEGLGITCKAAAVTPGSGAIIFTGTAAVSGSRPGTLIFTGTAVVLALTWRRDWMLKTVGGCYDICSYINSLLQRLSEKPAIFLGNQNMGHSATFHIRDDEYVSFYITLSQ